MDEAELHQRYPKPHDASRFPDHQGRVEATIELLKLYEVNSIADLSCGNGAIARSANAEVTILGDLAEGYDICGPIEETILQIPHVEMFILSETLEHLDDPDLVLRTIRLKSDHLILSTPLTPDGGEDRNIEHYWSWDDSDIELMLKLAGWEADHYTTFDGGFYNWQIWGCS